MSVLSVSHSEEAAGSVQPLSSTHPGRSVMSNHDTADCMNWSAAPWTRNRRRRSCVPERAPQNGHYVSKLRTDSVRISEPSDNLTHWQRLACISIPDVFDTTRIMDKILCDVKKSRRYSLAQGCFNPGLSNVCGYPDLRVIYSLAPM